MINALKGLGHNQYEWARWAREDCDKYKLIPVQRISDDERRWSTILQNISTVADSVLLRTASVYDYQPRQHVFYRNKWYTILSVREVAQEINPQSLALVNNGCTQYVLELTEVNGYDVDGIYKPVQ